MEWAKVAEHPGHSGGRLPGRNAEECGRRQVRYEIAQEVVGHQGEGRRARRCKVDCTKNSRAKDFSQIENEKWEEEEVWQKEKEMELQWAEDGKLEKRLERSRMDGSSLQAEVMQKGTRVSGA